MRQLLIEPKSELIRRSGLRFDDEFALIVCSHKLYFSIVKNGQQKTKCCDGWVTSGHEIIETANVRAALVALIRGLRARMNAGGLIPKNIEKVWLMVDKTFNLYFRLPITRRKIRLIRIGDGAEFVLDRKTHQFYSLNAHSSIRRNGENQYEGLGPKKVFSKQTVRRTSMRLVDKLSAILASAGLRMG